MNEIVNRFLLVVYARNAFKTIWFYWHLVLVVHLQKKRERIGKFMQTGNTNFIYKNELYKACFQHDMVNGKSKDLAKRTQSDKVLRDKAFKIASDPKHVGYQRRLASVVYKFGKKSSGSGIVNEPNYQLANELHKPIIRKLKKEKFIHLLETIFGVFI